MCGPSAPNPGPATTSWHGELAPGQEAPKEGHAHAHAKGADFSGQHWSRQSPGRTMAALGVGGARTILPGVCRGSVACQWDRPLGPQSHHTKASEPAALSRKKTPRELAGGWHGVQETDGTSDRVWSGFRRGPLLPGDRWEANPRLQGSSGALDLRCLAVGNQGGSLKTAAALTRFRRVWQRGLCKCRLRHEGQLKGPPSMPDQ